MQAVLQPNLYKQAHSIERLFTKKKWGTDKVKNKNKSQRDVDLQTLGVRHISIVNRTTAHKAGLHTTPQKKQNKKFIFIAILFAVRMRATYTTKSGKTKGGGKRCLHERKVTREHFFLIRRVKKTCNFYGVRGCADGDRLQTFRSFRGTNAKTTSLYSNVLNVRRLSAPFADDSTADNLARRETVQADRFIFWPPGHRSLAWQAKQVSFLPCNASLLVTQQIRGYCYFPRPSINMTDHNCRRPRCDAQARVLRSKACRVGRSDWVRMCKRRSNA